MATIAAIALILAIIGAINWGLVGFFNWNLVDAIFGAKSALSRVIYALVGLSGLYLLIIVGKLLGALRM